MPPAVLTDGFREAVKDSREMEAMWSLGTSVGVHACTCTHMHPSTDLMHTHIPTHLSHTPFYPSLSHTHPSTHLMHTCTHTPTHPHTSAHLTIHQSIKHSLDLSAFFTFLDSHRGFTLCREAVGQNQLSSPGTVSEYCVIREVCSFQCLGFFF